MDGLVPNGTQCSEKFKVKFYSSGMTLKFVK